MTAPAPDLRLGLSLLALFVVGVAGALGLVFAAVRAGESAGAQRLADAEMDNVASKIAGLTPEGQARELALLAAQRHLASQIARGATEPARSGTACATPERDRRIIAVRFTRAPGETQPDIGHAGTLLAPESFALAPRGGAGAVALSVPPGAACNPVPMPARATIRRFGSAVLVTGWMLPSSVQAWRQHWGLGLLAGLAAGALGLVAVVMVARQSAARMSRLTAVLERVGAGDFEARAVVPGERGNPAALAASIDAMSARLKALTDSLATLIDRTAHDLRTPLARALARVSEATTQAPPDMRARLDAVGADLRDLSARFASMLALRELEARRLDTAEPVDLRAIALMAADLYDGLETRGVRVVLEPGPAAIVLGDRGLLQNAIANLVDNAVKFSPDDGLVRVAVHDAGDRVIVVVRDSGPGLDPRIAERAFEAGVATQHPGGGHGLGLATAREVARLHGGAIELRDGENGVGAVATLTFTAPPNRG